MFFVNYVYFAGVVLIYRGGNKEKFAFSQFTALLCAL